jgi:hypothetical protein
MALKFQTLGTTINWDLIIRRQTFVVHFYLLPAASALEANPSVRGLHYVLIYVSYNEILPLLHLYYFCANNISYLSCERLRIVELDDYNILQPRHLVGSRLGGSHYSISIWNLSSHGFACTSSQAMSLTTKEHLVWHDLRQIQVSGGTKCPCNSDGSRSSKVWSGELRLYATRPRH